jgi:hypothetical protein
MRAMYLVYHGETLSRREWCFVLCDPQSYFAEQICLNKTPLPPSSLCKLKNITGFNQYSNHSFLLSALLELWVTCGCPCFTTAPVNYKIRVHCLSSAKRQNGSNWQSVWLVVKCFARQLTIFLSTKYVNSSCSEAYSLHINDKNLIIYNIQNTEHWSAANRHVVIEEQYCMCFTVFFYFKRRKNDGIGCTIDII